MEEMVGSILPVTRGELIDGRFEVEEVIGSGGAGIVVAAKHLALGERVAVKFLKKEARKHQTDVARFMREARALAHLKNEHVARVSDVGKLPDGSPYIVMEFLVGQDMARLLTLRGKLSIQEAVDYVLQACEALAEAHAQGIIHRDIKPSNLFMTVSRDGRTVVKLLDFGIAKASVSIDTMDVALTHSSTMVGSPLYMSPEQIRDARSVDFRTDIWSLGVVLYELLAGTPPFAAESLTGVVAAVISNRVPNLTEIPEGLRRVIQKCLEKEPEGRWETVLQLATALEPYGSVQSQGVSGRIRASMDSPEALASSGSAVALSRSRANTWSNPTPIPVSTSQEKEISRWTSAPPGTLSIRTSLTLALAVAIPIVIAGTWWLVGRSTVKASSEVSHGSAVVATFPGAKSGRVTPEAGAGDALGHATGDGGGQANAAARDKVRPASSRGVVVGTSRTNKALVPTATSRRGRRGHAKRASSSKPATKATSSGPVVGGGLLDDTVDTRY